MNVDIEKIRTLADLALEKGLAEITVADGDKTVTLKLPTAQTVLTAPAPVVADQKASVSAPSTSNQSAPPASAPSDDQYHKVTSPMVGTYYASPSPDAPPFVSVGATIAKGQTICILEAMKMMNELESEVSGKVVKLLIENGKPVEYGQPLMLVDTNA